MINKTYLRYYLHALQLSIYYITGYSKINQRKSLYQLLQYVKLHNPYYNKLLCRQNITYKNVFTILKDLPLLSKETIKQEGNNIYDKKITKSWSNWRNTGGSTGEPLYFPILYLKNILFDRELIHQAYLFSKMGCWLTDKMVSFDGVRIDSERIKQHIFWSKTDSNFPYGGKRYSVLYLDEDNFNYFFEDLNKEKPVIIRGYPSAIKLLCQIIKKNKAKLCFNPKAVYLTSENFDNEMATYIANTLNCNVWGQYGHTEISVFAYKKPNESCYYCSPLYGVTEILNEEGNPVEEGVCGEIVVTGFTNVGLPFIRYKTGDLAIYGGTLKNGTVVLRNLLGRAKDFIYDKNNKKIYLVGFIFGGHIKAFNDIKEWQIHQKIAGELSVYIVKGSTYSAETETELFNFFSNNNFKVNIIYTNKLEKTIRGKQKFLIQEIKE